MRRSAPDTPPCSPGARPRAGRAACLVALVALVATFALGTTAEALQEPGGAPAETPKAAATPGGAPAIPHDPAVDAPSQASWTIQSEPSGALVAVDGVKVGTTPLEHALTPGPHTVELYLRGFHLHAEQVSVATDTAETLVRRLEPDPFAAPLDPKYRRRSVIAAGSLLGSSVALVAAGATLLALDDDPIRGRCRDYADPSLDCPHRHQTNLAGTTLLVAGLGTSLTAAVVAIVFNQRVRNHRRRPAALQPAWAGLGLAF